VAEASLIHHRETDLCGDRGSLLWGFSLISFPRTGYRNTRADSAICGIVSQVCGWVLCFHHSVNELFGFLAVNIMHFRGTVSGRASRSEYSTAFVNADIALSGKQVTRDIFAR